MAEAVVSVTLQILGDLLLKEAKFLSGVGSEVKELQMQLKEMKCLLEDADAKQHKSQSVRNWIAEIKDLAHRAEDVIETYAVQVSYNREMGFRHLLNRFACVFLNRGCLLHDIGSEVSRIKSEVARVEKSMKEYGIKSIVEGETSADDQNQRWKRQTYANFEIEDCFVGKEAELEQLISLLTDKQDRVISVWGMGGIGKTTICRKVYNHVKIRRSFESFAWVCITKKCQIRSVFEDVFKQLISHNCSNLSDRDLIEELSQIQKVKRCMIVIDDLWEIDHWDCLKHAFLVEGLSSKILITTRKQSVVKEGIGFELGLLNVDEGWELLKKKAFPHSNIPDFAVEENLLQKLGKEMVRQCDYLPLVISLLGGVLNKKRSIEEWKLVNENINTYLYRGDGLDKENEIHKVLNLSYEDLPYHLKPCFLYMSQFREDQTIYVRTLYRLWIAEGMISHGHNQGNDDLTLMDIAELYLTELASRSIVQVQVEDEARDQKYSTCRLHDAVRSLCLSKGENEDFGLQIIEYNQGGNLSTLLGSKTRHLAIHCHDQVEVKLQSEKYIRSLQFINVASEKKIEFPHNILDLQKFKLLRILLIHGCKFKGRKLPRGIANLVLLKYLGLFYCSLDKLPSSICRLTYLYSLDLLGSWNVQVPNVLKKMQRLKHLILPYYNEEKMGKYKLRLEGLEELEILYGFNSLVHDLKSVTRMKNLRRFEAIAHDNESLSAIINAVITNWKKLRFCKLVIRQGCQFTTSSEKELTILKKVFACPNLHDLRIHVYIGKLIHECQSEMIGSRLICLQLMECEIEEDPMEILGKLPLLEQLFLLTSSFVGDMMKCNAKSFPCLKNLVLKDLPNLREWRVQKGAMPVVSEIEINHCSRLEKVPDGFRFITTLQKLKICRMSELGKRVLASTDDGREGEDFDKIRRVPFITIVG